MSVDEKPFSRSLMTNLVTRIQSDSSLLPNCQRIVGDAPSAGGRYLSPPHDPIVRQRSSTCECPRVWKRLRQTGAACQQRSLLAQEPSQLIAVDELNTDLGRELSSLRREGRRRD